MGKMMNESLKDLAIRYLKRKGYSLEKDYSQEGQSGIVRKFDLFARRGDTAYPVWIKNWKRTVGVNIVINIDKASEDIEAARPILISNKFSDHARAYANRNRRGIQLITKSEIQRSLR